MREQFQLKRALVMGVMFSAIFLLLSCNDGGVESDNNNLKEFTGTYSLNDFSVQSGENPILASQALENFSVDAVMHEDGFMELLGCFKRPGEPEVCGADTGMVEGGVLTISEAGCTYSATLQMNEGNLSWKFPPSCGNTGNDPSVWHWTKASDTTPKSLMSPEGELINMITQSIKMISF
jgi:hypothetical protein